VGREHNRQRRLWQDYAGANAARAETDFFSVFRKNFEGTEFQIRARPKEFEKLYVSVPLPKDVLAQIYTPNKPVERHGVFPDYAISHKSSEKTIFIEVKRQDGWVEGKKRSDGRGNAHERSCKFFTPGLLQELRSRSKIKEPALPFWTVFLGDITRDPCRVREVTLWYGHFTAHYFFWRDTKNPATLFEHFDHHIKPLLES
jgi:hypothetical protein